MKLQQAIQRSALRNHPTKIRGCRTDDRAGELRPVLQIDGVKPQLQGDTLADLEFALGVHVPLVSHVRAQTIDVRGEHAPVKGGGQPCRVALEVVCVEPAIERAIDRVDLAEVGTVNCRWQWQKECGAARQSSSTWKCRTCGVTPAAAPYFGRQ